MQVGPRGHHPCGYRATGHHGGWSRGASIGVHYCSKTCQLKIEAFGCKINAISLAPHCPPTLRLDPTKAENSHFGFQPTGRASIKFFQKFVAEEQANRCFHPGHELRVTTALFCRLLAGTRLRSYGNSVAAVEATQVATFSWKSMVTDLPSMPLFFLFYRRVLTRSRSGTCSGRHQHFRLTTPEESLPGKVMWCPFMQG